MENSTNINLNNNALYAGLAYLALIIVGLYGFVYVFPQIIIEGNLPKTIENIQTNPFLFRIGTLSILVMNVVSILLVIYLYRLLSGINKTMGLSMLILMLFGAAISLVNEVNHFAMIIINNMEGLSGSENQNMTELFSILHNHGAHIAVIFWGLWLFPLGVLVYKLNTRISKFIGIMLVIAGIGYLSDAIALLLFPNLQIPTLSDFTFIGEFLFTIWLLTKSRSIEKLTQIDANNVASY